jgi:hypothetical protein
MRRDLNSGIAGPLMQQELLRREGVSLPAAIMTVV